MERTTIFVVAAMSLAQGMVFYDISAIGIALPEMRNALELNSATLPWVVNAYIVSYAACVAVAGRLGDAIGTRATFCMGVGFFLLGSALAGATPHLHHQSASWILTARVIQGVGGALIMPTSLAIVLKLVPKERRGRIVGYVVSGAQAIFVMGPLLGGVLAQHVSWRGVFYLALPAGIAALAIVASISWTEQQSGKSKAELSGYLGLSAVLASGLALLVFGLQDTSGASQLGVLPVAAIAIGIGLLFVFAVLNRLARHKLLPLKLFKASRYRHFSFAVACTQMFAVAVCVFVPQALQIEFQLSPSVAGFVLLAFVGGWIVVVPVTGRVFDKFGPYHLLLVGPSITLAGFVVFDAGSYRGSLLYSVLGLFIAGVGTGLTVLPSYVSAVAVGDDTERGSVVGLTQTIRQVAGSLSIALLSGVFVFSAPQAPMGYAAVGPGYRWMILLLLFSVVVNAVFYLGHRKGAKKGAEKA
ncbi:MAG: MFS transporter [Pseudomonadota bacterium]